MGPILFMFLSMGLPCVVSEPIPEQPLPIPEQPVSFLYQPAFSIDHELRWPAEPYCPQPGDIFLATGCEIWAKLGHFAAFTGAPQHSGIVVRRPDGSLALLEGGPRNTLYCRGMDLLPELQFYAVKERVWIRRRRVGLTPAQDCALTAFAEAVNGKSFALGRLLLQITPFRTRGPRRLQYLGYPQGPGKSHFFCSELVVEALVAAGLLDYCQARPSATYPRDLFFGRSRNPFLDKHLDLSQWAPPARWTSHPGTEYQTPKKYPILDRDGQKP